MAKRIVTKIGYVFCIEIEGQYKCYFQYVANDLTQLNSSVIRVSKTRYPIDYVPDIEAIVNDEVYFYAHTILRVGIDAGAWYKVGKSKNIGEPDKIMFKLFSEGDYSQMTKSYRWYVWQLNKEHVFIGEQTDAIRGYDLGWVVPYIDIVSKIKTGKFAIRVLE